MFALTRDLPSIYGRLQEGFLEERPGVPHVCKIVITIVITDPPVTQRLDIPGQVGDLAGDLPGSVHHGLYPGLGSH